MSRANRDQMKTKNRPEMIVWLSKRYGCKFELVKLQNVIPADAFGNQGRGSGSVRVAKVRMTKSNLWTTGPARPREGSK